MKLSGPEREALSDGRPLEHGLGCGRVRWAMLCGGLLRGKHGGGKLIGTVVGKLDGTKLVGILIEGSLKGGISCDGNCVGCKPLAACLDELWLCL